MRRVTEPSLIQPELRRVGTCPDAPDMTVYKAKTAGVLLVLRVEGELAEEAGDEGVQAGDFMLEEVEEPEGGAVGGRADDQGDDVHGGAAVPQRSAQRHGLTRAHAPAQ